MSAAFDAEPYESLADFHQDWEEILGYPLLHLYDTEELVKIAEDSCCRLPQMPVLPELILVFARILATTQRVFSHVDENLRVMIGVIGERLVLPMRTTSGTKGMVKYCRKTRSRHAALIEHHTASRMLSPRHPYFLPCDFFCPSPTSHPPPRALSALS